MTDRKIALVTGAGGGLGRALALDLAGRGVTVAGFGRGMAALEETARLAGGGFHPIPCDVSDPDQIRAGFAAVAAIGDLDILINNAALYPRRDILDETPESFAAVMDVNFNGLLGCSLAALAVFVPRGQGRILNVATFADLAPIPASAAYSVSKGAARILTRALIADLGDRFPRIVINDWMPGMLNTGIGIAAGLDPAISARWGATLALSSDQSLSGTTWEMDREIPAPRGWKRRLLDRLTGGGKPRRI